MDILWPGFFFLLGFIPLLIAVYIWTQRRKRTALRYSSLSLVREAMPRSARLRRHLPFALMLLAFACLVLALVRPVMVLSVPTDQTTIMLTMDVSRSMCSNDIKPNRIQAAEAAALAFIDAQKARTHIGIVAFSGFAELIQLPTTESQALRTAIQSLTTGRRTAIGSGIIMALDAIAEVDPAVAPTLTDVTPVVKGAYAPDIIVLLTDGASNVGPLPLDAAQLAADRGVRVYTIGFGTAKGGEFPDCDNQFLGNEPFFNGGGRGGGGQQGFGAGGFRRGIDEDTLKKVAALTGGKYYSAESADELQSVFTGLPTNLIVKHETTEISFVFSALGLLLALLSILLAMLWFPLG